MYGAPARASMVCGRPPYRPLTCPEETRHARNAQAARAAPHRGGHRGPAGRRHRNDGGRTETAAGGGPARRREPGRPRGRRGIGGSSDEAGEEAWRPGRGAVFLANVDDDSRRCRLRPGDLDRIDPAVDERLAACHDAADERVNGVRDEADLAPLRVPPLAVGDQASGRLEVPAAQRPYVRLFVRRDGALRALRGPLTARELRAGVELALEGRDVCAVVEHRAGAVTGPGPQAPGRAAGPARPASAETGPRPGALRKPSVSA
ncbi:hypothetical protein [Streptomyces caelestis]|uniref:Uncharacterized protein n=1 Tax=Streptomyces caelestis TaxID=36816 RepID=A0A7W9HD49_9ACTN|nr:hypothetical protein [Streptomyces caelestis]MBB5800015.1 hypothetical protein [Streptomyces caelestis]